MPVRLASWNSSAGLLPIFDMNLPEGGLRARLVRASPTLPEDCHPELDDIDLLAVVGRLRSVAFVAPPPMRSFRMMCVSVDR